MEELNNLFFELTTKIATLNAATAILKRNPYKQEKRFYPS